MNNIKNIQLKFIAIQLFAFNFLILSARSFAYLSDLKLSFILSSLKQDDKLSDIVRKYNINGIQINDLTQNIRIFHVIGFLIGCLISYLIVTKRKIKKLNLTIIIILSFLIFFIKSALNPLKPLKIENLFTRFETLVIFNGCLFLILTLILFYLSRKIKLNEENQ